MAAILPTEKTAEIKIGIEFESENMEDLMNIQFTHAKTDKHATNFIKYLMLDIDAKTLEEIPKKLEEYMNEIDHV